MLASQGPSTKTCFVIMPIGEQIFGSHVTSEQDLRNKYNHLLKEALAKARPQLEITRADEIALPGTVTTDIITRIMHSDYVIADITHPNPNVYYELGLRHACRPGTIIIRERNSPKPPFDVANLRYIEYENTPTGLKTLTLNLGSTLDFIDKDSARPDNHLLEIAKLTGYRFQEYRKITDQSRVINIADIISGLASDNSQFIINQILNLEQYSKTLSAVDEPVQNFLSNKINDLNRRSKAYSQGRVDVPIVDAPTVNFEIMEMFGDRMDAVSKNDISFWQSKIGKEYLTRSVQPKWKAKKARLTRIFILNLESLATNLNEIADVAEHHLANNIGFSFVINESLGGVRQKFGILDQSESEDAPRLDFALFNSNHAVTFFRSTDSSEHRRFKAIFRVNQGESSNNRLIQRQRSIWLDLISESWLISGGFRKDLEQCLTSEEVELVKSATEEDIDELRRNTGFSPEDPWFPFVANTRDEIITKTPKILELFRRHHNC